MTKKLLLAGIALGALTFAGAASAHDLTYRSTASATDIDADDVYDPADFPTRPGKAPAGQSPGSDDQTLYGMQLVGLYLVAEESLDINNGTLALVDTLEAGSLPSGNTVLEVALDGATFGANFAATAIVGGPGCTTFTVVRSTGGTASDNEARFIISNTDPGCQSFTLDVPVNPDFVGTVSVRTSLRTEGDNPIDGGDARLDAIFAVNAFQSAINGTVGSAAGAEGDDFALLNPDPTYTNLSDNGILGKVQIYVDNRAQRDLTPGNFVDVADVIEADVAVESTASNGFTAFDGGPSCAGNPELEGNPSDSVSGNRVVFNGELCGADPEDYIVSELQDKPNGSAFDVDEDGGVIASSSYDAFIFFTLDPTFYGDDEKDDGKDGDFESIRREGTNVILPWMNDGSRGTNNIVRIGNLSGNDADVSAVVRNSDDGTPGTIVPIDEVEAFDELVLTSATLQDDLGNFGRGDIELIIEAEPGDITVRRYEQRGDSFFELSNGTIASEQTQNLQDDVP